MTRLPMNLHLWQMLLRTCWGLFPTTGSPSAASRGNWKCRGVVQSHQPMGLGRDKQRPCSLVCCRPPWTMLKKFCSGESPLGGIKLQAPCKATCSSVHPLLTHLLSQIITSLRLPIRKTACIQIFTSGLQLQEPKWMIYPFYPAPYPSTHAIRFPFRFPNSASWVAEGAIRQVQS